MTSAFGWLDNDDEQRRRMLEVVDLFREQGTIDELGIGAVRDTLANAMFPGTSTLHTRLRYVLFLPWLMQLSSHKKSSAEMGAEFRELQFRLAESLKAGGEDEGVMGNVAGRKLKRLPGEVYWSALRAWGLIESNSPDAFFRRASDLRSLQRRIADADDPEAYVSLASTGIDPSLPTAPSDLMSRAVFALTRTEEEHLSYRLTKQADGTLLAWLVENEPANSREGAGQAHFPWEISNRSELPPELAGLVEHARRFSVAVNGAALVYNLALARKAGWDDRVDDHTAALQQWHAEGGTHDAATWDRDAWWDIVRRHNPALRPLTRGFVDRWLEISSNAGDLTASVEAATLVETRERQIKGSRARFVNQSALDKWSGSSGLGRLDFRWANSISHLRDIYEARGAA